MQVSKGPAGQLEGLQLLCLLSTHTEDHCSTQPRQLLSALLLARHNGVDVNLRWCICCFTPSLTLLERRALLRNAKGYYAPDRRQS